MADFPTQGAALKKIIERSKTRNIHFGFNPGTDGDDHYFAADLLKTPEFLGKIVRNEGLGAKVAYGTFTTQGNIITLQCDKSFPALQKTFFRLLRQNNIGLMVEVVENEVAPEGLEPAAEDPPPEGSRIVSPRAVEGRGGTDGDELRRMRALAQRFKELQSHIAATPPQVRGKLSEAAKTVAISLRGGNGDEAEARMAKIDAVLLRLAQGGAAEQAKWERAVEMLEAQITASDAEDLRVQWYRAARMADEGAYARALAELPAIVARLKAETQA